MATDAQAINQSRSDKLITPANVAAWAADTDTYAFASEVQALTDPGADRILGYDSSTDTWKWFTVTQGLEISNVNFRFHWDGMTELAAADVDTTNDLVVIYDTSAGVHRATAVGNLPAITGSGQSEDFKYKTADESVTSSDTLQDDDHLSGWSLDASTLYRFEIHLWVEAATSTPDIKVAFQVDNALTDSQYTIMSTSDGGASIADGETDVTTAHSRGLTAGARTGIRLQGFVLTGGSATVIDLQWAQAVNNATATTVYAGSWGYFEAASA